MSSVDARLGHGFVFLAEFLGVPVLLFLPLIVLCAVAVIAMILVSLMSSSR